MRKLYLLTWFGVFLMSAQSTANELPTIDWFFNAAERSNMEDVCRKFYAKNIHFVDPIGELNGLDKMISYYNNMYENVIDIRFDIHEEFTVGDQKMATWTMYLKHKIVNGGKEIVLDGSSHVKFNDQGRAVYHRDYFDPGPMIYEHVPVFGRVLKWVKGIVRDNTHTTP